ncbi:MAG: porin [Paracoccaceae bacterium]|jgi:outer membrane protein OmpU|nr:porin [Paracoccaceae bacterium]
MKKVLLTSTALVMTSASFAAAEIAISGSAEMGVVGGSASITTAAGNEFDETIPLQFFNDVDVTFSMSGETDGGLAFGVSVDLDEADNLGDEFDNQGVAIFISGDFGTLTMGDTDGAVDFVITDMGNIGNPGSIDDSETVHLGYLGAWLDGSGDNQVVRYDYSFDAFTFALSVEQMPSGANGLVREDDDDLTWGIGFGYDLEFAGGSLDLGIGYQYSDNGSLTVGDSADGNSITIPVFSGEVGATALGATVNLDNGLAAGITYTNFNVDRGSDVEHIGVGAGYAFDAFSVHANYGQWNADDATISGFGLSAGYDLGGGASLLFGYGNSDVDVDDSEVELQADTYSLGLSFSF